MRNYLLANQHNRRRNVLTVVNRRFHKLCLPRCRESMATIDPHETAAFLWHI